MVKSLAWETIFPAPEHDRCLRGRGKRGGGSEGQSRRMPWTDARLVMTLVEWAETGCASQSYGSLGKCQIRIVAGHTEEGMAFHVGDLEGFSFCSLRLDFLICKIQIKIPVWWCEDENKVS